jgi:glycosyltransferase involved in cell wall biosynthesis
MGQQSLMQIDVLTPSFNYRAYLCDAINSLGSQRGWSGRHVIADGASSDGTVEYLSAQGESFVLWESQADRGQSDALNQALARSNAEWVGWLNADEFYLPGALTHIEHEIEVWGDSCDVMYGDCAFVDAEGRFIRLLPSHRFSAWLLRSYGCFIPSCASFMRRELMVDAGWRLDYRRAMDWDLWLRLAEQGARFHYVPRVLACFRVHSGQITAVPESEDSEEFQRLAGAHRFPSHPFAGLRGFLGSLGHAAAKAEGNAYLRERAATRAVRDADLRWWRNDEASRAAALLAAV